jgi:hypothetical protein
VQYLFAGRRGDEFEEGARARRAVAAPGDAGDHLGARGPIAARLVEHGDVVDAARLGAVDDRRRHFAAPRVGEHLAHVAGQHQVLFHRFPFAQFLKRVARILSGRHRARIADGDALARRQLIDGGEGDRLGVFGADQDELIGGEHAPRGRVGESALNERVERRRAGEQRAVDGRAALHLAAQIAGRAVGHRDLGAALLLVKGLDERRQHVPQAGGGGERRLLGRRRFRVAARAQERRRERERGANPGE